MLHLFVITRRSEIVCRGVRLGVRTLRCFIYIYIYMCSEYRRLVHLRAPCMANVHVTALRCNSDDCWSDCKWAGRSRHEGKPIGTKAERNLQRSHHKSCFWHKPNHLSFPAWMTLVRQARHRHTYMYIYIYIYRETGGPKFIFCLGATRDLWW